MSHFARAHKKSALARTLPLLAGGACAAAGTPEPLPLESFGLRHGGSFEDIVTRRAMHGRITVTSCFEHEGAKWSLQIGVQNLASPGRESRRCIHEWRLGVEGGWEIVLERRSFELDDDRYMRREMTGTVTVPGAEADVHWSGLLPSDGKLIPPELHEQLSGFRDALSRWAQGLRYLRSPRQLVDSPFLTPNRVPESMGSDGRKAPLVLAACPARLEDVREWYRQTFNVSLDVREQGEYSLVEVHHAAGGPPTPISQTGQGLSQVLPVVVQMFTAASEGEGIDLIEHPEAELHPNAHAAVAELILSKLPGLVRPVVIETHSEMMLLRARRWVAERKLSPKDLAIHWVDVDQEGSAHVRRIGITPTGEVTNWPEGVFYEDYDEILAIRRAARGRGE